MLLILVRVRVVSQTFAETVEFHAVRAPNGRDGVHVPKGIVLQATGKQPAALNHSFLFPSQCVWIAQKVFQSGLDAFQTALAIDFHYQFGRIDSHVGIVFKGSLGKRKIGMGRNSRREIRKSNWHRHLWVATCAPTRRGYSH